MFTLLQFDRVTILLTIKDIFMGRHVDVTCPQCGGACFLDDHYDDECQKWIQKTCPKCSGNGVISVWYED